MASKKKGGKNKKDKWDCDHEDEVHLTPVDVHHEEELDKKVSQKKGKKKLKKEQEYQKQMEVMVKEEGAGHSELDANFTESQAEQQRASFGINRVDDNAIDTKVEMTSKKKRRKNKKDKSDDEGEVPLAPVPADVQHEEKLGDKKLSHKEKKKSRKEQKHQKQVEMMLKEGDAGHSELDTYSTESQAEQQVDDNAIDTKVEMASKKRGRKHKKDNSDDVGEAPLAPVDVQHEEKLDDKKVSHKENATARKSQKRRGKKGKCDSDDVEKIPAALSQRSKKSRCESDGTTDLSRQSLHQLMMNPSALSAGCALLHGLRNKTITAKEVGIKIGLTNSRTLRSSGSKIEDCTRRVKFSDEVPAKKTGKGLAEISAQVQRSQSKKTAILKKAIPEPEATSSSDESDLEATGEGEAVLQELMKRAAMGGDACGQQEFTELVFTNHALKKSLVDRHTKNIQRLTPEQLKEHFVAVINEVAEVYKGRKPSIRHDKFKEGISQEKSLRELNVTHPFNNVQSGTVIDLVYDSFFADKSRRYNWSNYVCNVLIPEVFIRIYAHVNDLNFDMAEKEMLYGEDYEGPVNEHRNSGELGNETEARNNDSTSEPNVSNLDSSDDSISAILLCN